MEQHKRSTRVDLKATAILTKKDVDSLQGVLKNLSTSGVYVGELSGEVKTDEYCRVIIKGLDKIPVKFIARIIRVDDQGVGMQITEVDQETSQFIAELVADKEDADTLAEMLNSGVLDYLFIDEDGKKVEVTYTIG